MSRHSFPSNCSARRLIITRVGIMRLRATLAGVVRSAPANEGLTSGLSTQLGIDARLGRLEPRGKRQRVLSTTPRRSPQNLAEADGPAAMKEGASAPGPVLRDGCQNYGARNVGRRHDGAD